MASLDSLTVIVLGGVCSFPKTLVRPFPSVWDSVCEDSSGVDPSCRCWASGALRGVSLPDSLGVSSGAQRRASLGDDWLGHRIFLFHL